MQPIPIIRVDELKWSIGIMSKFLAVLGYSCTRVEQQIDFDRQTSITVARADRTDLASSQTTFGPPTFWLEHVRQSMEVGPIRILSYLRDRLRFYEICGRSHQTPRRC